MRCGARTRRGRPVVALVAIRLEESAVALEKLRRHRLCPAEAEVVDHLGPGDPVGPEESALHLTVLHPDPNVRVVGLHQLRGEDVPLHLEHDRLEEAGDLAHPVAQGLSAEVNAHPSEDLLLAVEGEVVAVLRDGDVGEEPDSRASLLDRPGGQRRDHHAFLAVAAPVLDACDLADVALAGDVLELLGDLLADRLHFLAAAGADAVLGIRVDLLALAEQVLRQGLATVGSGPSPLPLPLRAFLVLRLVLVLDGLLGLLEEIVEEEELVGVDLLGAPAEDPLEEALDAGLEAAILDGEGLVLRLEGLLLLAQDRDLLLELSESLDLLLDHGGMIS